MDEPHLIRRCQKGDGTAFETLFAHYSRRVLRTAYLITGDPSAAEDVLQEAFVQTFRAIHQLKEPSAFSSWLYRTTVRAARRYLQRERTAQNTQAHAMSTLNPTHTAPDHAVLTRQLVWAAIEKLPEQYRVAIVLHYFNDRSVAEIADILDVPVGTVKSWLHRARSALADELGYDVNPAGGESSHGWVDQGDPQRKGGGN